MDVCNLCNYIKMYNFTPKLKNPILKLTREPEGRSFNVIPAPHCPELRPTLDHDVTKVQASLLNNI